MCMAATYDYTNGKMERDFHFVKWDEKCRESGLPCRAGSNICSRCPHYDGSIHPSSFGPEYWGRLDDSYVLCKHPDKEDAKDSGVARHLFYERLKHKALCALCY